MESFIQRGLEFLVNRKSTARAMSLESGLTGIVNTYVLVL